MYQITDQQSSRFRNCALFCAFLVVVIHCVSNFHIEYWPIKMGLYDGFCRLAVPFFFFTSGFFLATHVDKKGWYGREVVKRISSLLVPYVTLTLLYFGFILGVLVAGNCVAGRALFENTSWLTSSVVTIFGLNIFEHPLLAPLWYIRSLFILVLISPLLVKLTSMKGLLLLFALYGIVGPWEGLDGDFVYFFRKVVALQGVFYFTLGIACRSKGLFFSRSRKFHCSCLCIGVVLMLGKVTLQKFGFTGYVYLGWLSVPLLLIALLNFMSSVRLPKAITSLAFPIYLVHHFLISAIVVVLNIMKTNIGSCIALWAFITCGVFVSSLLLTLAQRRFAPGLNCWLYGGR